MNFHQIDNVIIEGKGVDSFLYSADYKGVPMTEEQLESISLDMVYDLILKYQ